MENKNLIELYGNNLREIRQLLQKVVMSSDDCNLTKGKLTGKSGVLEKQRRIRANLNQILFIIKLN